MAETHIISTLVENKPGVLHKVSNMFRSRGYNIDGISVGPTQQPDLSRMTITIMGDERTVDQLVKQLGKLIDVIEVNVMNPKDTVYRELALVKLRADSAEIRSAIISYARIFRCRIVDVSPQSMIVEITGTPDKIDAFIQLASSYGVKDLSRTGMTALPRG